MDLITWKGWNLVSTRNNRESNREMIMEFSVVKVMTFCCETHSEINFKKVNYHYRENKKNDELLVPEYHGISTSLGPMAMLLPSAQV